MTSRVMLCGLLTIFSADKPENPTTYGEDFYPAYQNSLSPEVYGIASIVMRKDVGDPDIM